MRDQLRYTDIKAVLLWGFLLVLSVPILADPCELPQAIQVRLELERLNGANKSLRSIAVADSLLNTLALINLDNCPAALRVKYEKGTSLEMEMDFQQALEVYYKIITEAEAQQLWELAAQSYISIARCHEFLSRPKDCRRNLDIAKSLIDKHGLDQVIGRFSGRFASYHRIFASRDTAEIYAMQAIEYGTKYNDIQTKIDGHLLMGIVSQDKEIAISHFRMTSDLFVSIKDYEAAAGMSENIISTYLRSGQYKLAEQEMYSANKFLLLTDKSSKDYFHIKANYHEQKKELFEHYKNIDSAYFHIQKSIDAERKANWVVDQQQVTQNAIAFSIEKEKEKAIALGRTTKLQRIWSIVMSIMALILSLFVYHFFSKRKQIAAQNDLITLRNEELNKAVHKQALLLSEVHHRVKNNLQLVISLLTLQGNRSDNDAIVQRFEEVSNKVRSIALIHEQLYSEGEFDQINLKNYLNALIEHFKRLGPNEGHITFDLDIKDIYLNIDTILPLGIICSELLSNSFKYAISPQQNLVIRLSAKTLENKYVFSFQDNGPGYKESLNKQIKKQIGMKLIHDMVRQLMAESKTYNENGAVFKMIFAEKKISTI